MQQTSELAKSSNVVYPSRSSMYTFCTMIYRLTSNYPLHFFHCRLTTTIQNVHLRTELYIIK